MPKSAPRPCTYPGCGRLTQSGRCSDHPYKQNRTKAAKSYNKIYKTARWLQARKIYLAKFPLCVHCEQDGITKLADVVDHIIPHKGDLVLFWDESNWQGLCFKHHNRKTAREDGGFGNDLPEH